MEIMENDSMPALKNKIILFLKRDSGFENMPKVDVLYNKYGYRIVYENVTSAIIAFGENAQNAYWDFIDKWERYTCGKHA